MTFVNALWFCGGLLCGGMSVAFMVACSIGSQRDREGRLLESLVELRRKIAAYDPDVNSEEWQDMLDRADVAISCSKSAQS